MCLIIFAWQSHPDYPLIVAANRDEFYRRPTRSAHFWPDQPDILAGRDLQAGGTWLGVNRQGRIAALTNVRDPRDNHPFVASRGELVAACLGRDSDIETALASIAERRQHYSGFNLLFGDGRRLVYTSNRSASTNTALCPGIYGLSNAALDTPWPKVSSAKTEIAAILQRDWQDLPARQAELFALLRDDRPAATEDLPDTGVGEETERLLSSRFIHSEAEEYGTRASTLVIYHRSGHIHFSEREFDRSTLTGQQQHLLQTCSSMQTSSR